MIIFFGRGRALYRLKIRISVAMKNSPRQTKSPQNRAHSSLGEIKNHVCDKKNKNITKHFWSIWLYRIESDRHTGIIWHRRWVYPHVSNRNLLKTEPGSVSKADFYEKKPIKSIFLFATFFTTKNRNIMKIHIRKTLYIPFIKSNKGGHYNDEQESCKH